MATLTGYKSVGDPANVSSASGQQNPVFVFDDVDVGDGDREDKKEEEFVDASSEPHEQQQQQQVVKKSNNSEQDGTNNSDMVAINISNSNDDQSANNKHQNEDTKTSKNKSNSNQFEPQTPPGEPASKGVGGSATGNQLKKGQQQPSARQQRAAAAAAAANNPTSLLSPNGDGDGDNVSVSMLAIDCVGTGKSPRTPRRSPLMALFRGKPRESVRRLYTDEDQFEIEWANLSLEVQQKWYQKINLKEMFSSDSDSINKPERPKLILNNVDGKIKSGEITAVLGPSGAGKTSLLNSLFGKYRTAVQGSIKVSGAPSKKHLTVCTIPQSDYLIGYLSTEECLWFASRLKNCEDDFNHDRNIERVIELLGLQRCRHTRINKLSGGQYKRVSIAQEMLSSPDILVLDEPTSGLDSLTCYRTVKVLRDLVEASKAHNLVNPMSIILTIHQPHREVLDLFHSVYVMAVGGQTLFQGPPNEMENFINNYSGTKMPAEGYNPASFMVELASEEYGRKPIDALVLKQKEKFKSLTKNNYEQNNYDNNININNSSCNEKETSLNNSSNLSKLKSDSSTTLYKSNKDNYVDIDLSSGATLGKGANNRSQAGSTNSGSQQQLGKSDIDTRIMTPRSGKNSDGVFWRHVNLMSKRCFLSNTRDPLLCTIRVGAHIFIPLVVALIYGVDGGKPNGCPFYAPEINLLEYASQGDDQIEKKYDEVRLQFQNVGMHFMVYYAFGLCMLAFTAISFPLIMHVLIKEIRNGWYSLSAFIFGKMFAELPMAIILPPISVAIIYTMTGQPDSYLHWRYMVQSLILILIILIAEAKGLVFGAICMNSMQTAVFAASVSTVPFILLCGFLIRIRDIPHVLQHFAKFSYFKHSVEALIITRYGFGVCGPCNKEAIPVTGIPKIVGIKPEMMRLTDYYLGDYIAAIDNNNNNSSDSNGGLEETNVVGNNRTISRAVRSTESLSSEILDADTTATTTTTITTTESPNGDTTEEKPQGIFFTRLAALLSKANSFGHTIRTCDDIAPITMKDMRLTDDMLPKLIGYLFLYIVILKFISYYIVEICVKLKL